MIGIDSILDFGKVLIERVIPDPQKKAEAQLKLMELAQSGDLAKLAAEKEVAVAQLEVNKQEAASASLFVSGWRPAIGWICGIALAYQFIIRPMVLFYLAIIAHPVQEVPGLDDTLWQLLFGMLGLGGLRTVEKIKKVA